MAEQVLSHAEVWDDDYLQNVWQEAVEEYKKYHSLAARGLDTEALVEELKRDGDLPSDEQVVEHINGLLPEDEGDEYDPGETMNGSTMQAKGNQTMHDPSRSPELAPTGRDHTSSGKQSDSRMPTAEVASQQVKDESVRNLMMSWYYAGFYAGVYEEQQRAQGSRGSR